MLPHFHLLTLGSPALLSAAGEQIRFRTRKHFAVLIRLALATGRRCTRAELMESLWPGVPERLARHSLAQAVTVVKAKLGREHVVVQRASLALAEGAVATDLDALDSGGADVRGRFLEGFEIPGSAAFEQWKDEWHARLLGRVRDALVRKMDAGRRIGEFASVERHAQTLLDLDPLSEDGVRGVMEARAWVGDRTNALKAFSRYEAALEEELGAKPSSDIVRMADLMRQGRRSPLRPPTTPEPPEARAERRMEPETIIGRSREFSILYDAWLDVRRRIPRVMVVTGDPGIGKTTLTNAFLSSCQMEGAVVARAQAYDAERELPYAVLAELVRQLTSQRAIGGADPDDLAELSRICADVNIAFPGVPKPPNWAAEVIPLRLADALLKTVKVASEENPVILVVDDIHAADDSSVAILHVVARKTSADHLMIVLVGRPAELRAVDAPHALTTDPNIQSLNAVSLHSLESDDAETLVRRLLKNQATDQERPPLKRVLEAARGNPLALELLTRDWMLHGANSLLRDIDVIDTRPVPTLEVPRAIAVVFERQVRRLLPITRSVVGLAAVLGRRLSDLDLYSVVGANPSHAANCLGELVEAGILREVGTELEFRNELIRAQAYYLVSGQSRQQLHHQVALAYVDRFNRDPDTSSLEIAWHFMRAREPARALKFALKGAEQALTVGATSEAEKILTAIGADRIDSGLPAVAHLLLAQSLLHQSKGEAVAPVLSVLDQVKSLTAAESAESAHLRATAEYLVNRQYGSRYSEAAAEALRAAEDLGDPRLHSRALFEYARSAMFGGDSRRISDAAHRAMALVDRREYEAIPLLHHTIAYCLYHTGSVVDAMEHEETARRILAESRDVPTTALILNGYGILKRAICEFIPARDAFTEALDLSRRMGDDDRAALAAINLSTLSVNHGDFASAVEYGKLSIGLVTGRVGSPDLGTLYLVLAEAFHLNGDREQANKCAAIAVDHASRHRSWHERVVFLGESTSHALLQGNTSLALSLIRQSREIAAGRTSLLPDAGTDLKFRVFEAYHTIGANDAWKVLNASIENFKECHPMNYLNALGAKGWLERLAGGAIDSSTQAAIESFVRRGVAGKVRLLQAQGFLE